MVPSVKKPATVRDLGSVDIGVLKGLVFRLSDRVWAQENERKENNFPCFHHTRHVIFRFIENNVNPEDYYSNPIWEVWGPVLLPVMTAVVKPFRFSRPEFPKVMLARLAAGEHIDEHIDGAGSNLMTHKIHVPIQTNSAAFFETNGEKFCLSEGRAYEVNNLARHSASNSGEQDRIHLIFEVFERCLPKNSS